MKQRKLSKQGWLKEKTEDGWLATLTNDDVLIAEIEYIRPYRKCYVFVHDNSFEPTKGFLKLVTKEIGRETEITIQDLT